MSTSTINRVRQDGEENRVDALKKNRITLEKCIGKTIVKAGETYAGGSECCVIRFSDDTFCKLEAFPDGNESAYFSDDSTYVSPDDL